MSYFIPSSLQKRLLRYALSRLELLDTDALELERLDIEWGRKSSVELKDVGLRRTNLAALLHLPDTIRVEYASVASVRVTVPADIHTSSIEVDIRGVGVRVKLWAEQQAETNHAKGSSREKFASPRRHGTPRLDSPPPFGTRRSSSGSLNDFLDGLPSAQDLAASYLADETLEDREELEAALNAQPTGLQQSTTLSEGSDDEPMTGIGMGLTLPSFLTNFFKGVSDRLKVTIQDVTLNLDLDIPSGSEIKSTVSEPSPMTISFHLNELDVQELKADSRPPVRKPAVDAAQKSHASSDSKPKSTHGRRRVGFRGMKASLIAESVAFDQSLVEFQQESPPKSVDSPVMSWTQDRSFLTSESAFAAKTSSINPSVSASIPSDSQHIYPFTPSVAQTTNASAFNKLYDAKEAEEDLISVSDSVYGLDISTLGNSSMKEQPRFQSEVWPQPIHSVLTSFREERSSPQGLYSSRYARERSPKESISQSHLSDIGHLSIDTNTPQVGHVPQGGAVTDSSALRSLDEVLHSAEEADPLAESKLFSHEEAESIYLSVIEDSDPTESEYFPMPGGWGDASTTSVRTKQDDTGHSNSDVPNQKSFQNLLISANATTGIQVDNLQHAAEIVRSVENGSLFTNTVRAMVKTFMHLDEAELWIQDSSDKKQQAGSATSTSPENEPSTRHGSSASYSVSSSLHDARRNRGNPSKVKLVASDMPTAKSDHQTQDSAFDVVVGLLEMSVDLTMCGALNQVVKQLQHAVARTASEETGKNSGRQDDMALPVPFQSLRLRMRNVELDIVKVIDPICMQSYSSGKEPLLVPKELPETILRTSISGMDLRMLDLSNIDNLNLDVKKLRVDLGKVNLLSFTSETNLRSSLRDQQKNNKDISLDISRVGDTFAVNVTTRPLVISANLDQVDHILGSYGGVSGLLEIGSSMASDTTPTYNAPRSQGRSRSVRFEQDTKDMLEPPRTALPKLNVRLGGALIAITTQNHGVKFQSSAVKIVARESVVGVQIDSIRIIGPNVVGTEAHGDLTVKLENTSIKFLSAPEEQDLTRLITLLTPSKDKFEDDDDFLLDTLLRQRRKGTVLRVSISKASTDIENWNAFAILQNLADEVSKYSAITKFLPEESRPGTLILVSINNIHCGVNAAHTIGMIDLDFGGLEIAHVGSPSLIALSVHIMEIKLDDTFQLVGEVVPCRNKQYQPPMLMARMIGDEMEPTARIKLWNTQFGYSVTLLMKFLKQMQGGDEEDIMTGLAASVITLTDRSRHSLISPEASHFVHSSSSEELRTRLDLAFRDCAINLEPLELPSRGLFVLTDGRILCAPPGKKLIETTFEIRRASLLIIDDVAKRSETGLVNFTATTLGSTATSNQITRLCEQGFVSVSSVSKAMVNIRVLRGREGESNILDIDFKDELLLLETCADSMQTVSELLTALVPPTPPSKGQKYRTEIAPVQDMMESFSGNAFTLSSPTSNQSDFKNDDFFEEDLVSDFDDLGDIPGISPRFAKHGRDSHTRTPSKYQPFASKWDSGNNKYTPATIEELKKAPLRLKIRDMHIIWNLHDGYDWPLTRDKITKAVIDVETRAEERRMRTRRNLEEDNEGSVIGDFLFNSIYIGVPLDHDPRELTRQINRNMDDMTSETGSQATNTTVRPNSAHGPRRKKLRLERSKRHKIAFEMGKVCADVFIFPAGGETQSSIDVRIHDFEVFDLVPTSTWRKFATYMHDSGPREEKVPMIHLEICDVRPIPELTASELVIRATVLPLRLHVDQDALDFITRFFDFHDDTPKVEPSSHTEQPYLQRVEVLTVPVKLDYKPKKVDYAGLRSGRSKEFMNFFILDSADMILKHTIVYGCSGFARLHQSLEDVWMPDIKKNQLPSVLSGLNGVRTLVNVGSGLRDLVVIPVKEYKKDGRIVRSISKGAVAFARQTGGEVTRFGAKLAIGAQTALQGAEEYFAGPSAARNDHATGWESTDLDADEKRAISHYAEQPMGILQGLKGAARSLERDLLVTRDIIIAISGEAREGGNVEEAAKAVVRHAPTLILRPMIGASKAISQTLMGATNTMDPGNRQRIEDKYKRY